MIDMTTHLDRLTPLMYALTRGGGRYRLGRVRIVEVHPRSDIVGGTQTQLHRLIGITGKLAWVLPGALSVRH